MSRTYKDAPQSKRQPAGRTNTRQRHLTVRSVRRQPPDLRKYSRAVIEHALAEAAAEASAAAETITAAPKTEDSADG